MKNEKITKAMKYNAIIEIMSGMINGVDVTPEYPLEMLVEFLEKEERATHKSKKDNEKSLAKKAEDNKVKDLIVDLLQDNGSEMRATEVWAGLGLDKPSSVQKTSYLLTALVKEGRVQKFVNKRITYYTV